MSAQLPHRPILSRFRQSEFQLLENWRRAQQPEIPNLSEAVRTLTTLGLKASAAESKRMAAKDKAA